LSKILERRGKEFILLELLQNAWDADATRVSVTLIKAPGARSATLTVEDDSPTGFRDLLLASTLFAESDKKSSAILRGRFCFGDKLALACCNNAEIISTTGGVRFDDTGRHKLRQKRERGTVFKAELPLTNAELETMQAAFWKLIPPSGIITTLNGAKLPVRSPTAAFEATLRTEIADADGNLRGSLRKTTVHVYPVRAGETGTIYELGIPVVETGDAYHADVQQKVPVGFDRDSVPPAYLRSLRTYVLNAVHEHMAPSESNSVWVRQAMGTKGVSVEAVRSVVEQRFGRQSVVYDPSDTEANSLAVTKGYTVVHGRQFSAEEWANVHRAGVLLPAGQVTPSPKPYEQGGPPVPLLPREEWSAEQVSIVILYQRLAPYLINREIDVRLVVAPNNNFLACFGPRSPLDLNLPKLGKGFFQSGYSQRVLDLLIHELGHEYESNHLSANYYRALTRIGARLALAVAANPNLIRDAAPAGLRLVHSRSDPPPTE
jgi:hypothetical protein